MNLISGVDRFRALHGEGELLVVPNAWDVLSARLAEEAGATAVATSSAAMAWARGYPDGECFPLDELVRGVRDIARVLRVPLTVDLEAGYATDPRRVADAVERVVAAGAVGVNLEEGAESAAILAEKVRAVRDRLGASVFVNARTCVVLRGKVGPERAANEVLTRARIFAEAGADGLFVPRLVDPKAIETVVRGTPLPLNVMLDASLPSLTALRGLGVRRVSLGPRLAEVAYGAAKRALRELLADRSYGSLVAGGLTYAEANGLFSVSNGRI